MRVSTIIPTFNRSQFVCEAIDSVLAQSHPVDEIIVIDDGSTDDTQEKLNSYLDTIKYIKQPNGGPGAARNRGLKEATGDIIALLDSDDLWVSNKIEVQLRFFREHPKIDFLFGNMASYTDSNAPEIKNASIHNYLCANATNLDHIIDHLIVENVIPTSTVMFRRAEFKVVGYFNESLSIAEDLDFWFRALQKCRFGYIDKVLEKRRIHDGNLVNDWVVMNTSHIEVLRKLQNTLEYCPKRTAKLIDGKLFELHYDLGSYYLKQRAYNAAYELFAGAPKMRPVDYRWLLKFWASCGLRFAFRNEGTESDGG